MSSIEKLENGEPIIRPVLGVQLTTLDNPYLMRNYQIKIPTDVENGVVVVAVESGSDAEKAGIQKGDIITKIEGKEITESSHFKYILYQYNIGNTIELTIVRGGKEKVIKVTLTASYGQ